MSKIISADLKISSVKEYFEGKGSQRQIAKRLGITQSSFQKWIMKFQSMGEEAFFQTGNKHYSKALKEVSVHAYLSGEGSLMEICKKYKIHSPKPLREWIKKYNSHEELKASGTGGAAIIMTKGRKTTFEERVEIVKYCIEHDYNYAETAKRYNISYQQARSYTVKFKEGGVDSLQDRRGKRKEQDQLSELEKLRAELKMEQAARKKAEMEVALLKKLQEIERRWS